ncbi:MAG: sodium-dependent transporter [Defluviitaleaceae bacterium]|nr:sodium-dependent transporter [Defluviitaleaceae bacterium]
MNKRETFSSKIAFIVVSISCAIGLGNIWLMPYRAGMYGGALYILLVAAFIFLLSIPVLLTEYAVGRGSGQSVARHYQVLQPKGSKWHVSSYLSIAGNYLLMMFYTVIVGFTLSYFWKGVTGSLIGQSPEYIVASFAGLTSDPVQSYGLTLVILVLGFLAISFGVKRGLERVSKYMMGIFFVLMLALIVRSVTLPGAYDGLAFLFIPNLSAMQEHGVFRIIHMAMGQALFSVSVGMGSMAIFGSYTSKDRMLFKDAFTVGVLDLAIAILCLIMIFPAAFAFGISPAVGEGLLFVTLPNIFNQMPVSYVWSLMFYTGLLFVSFSTGVAVMENLVAICMDKWNLSRKKSVIINFGILALLCMPAAFGRNIWSAVTVPGFPHMGSFFTFLVMENVLPIGSLIYVLFCMTKKGWGWDNFIAEANTGKEGWAFPTSLRFYMTYILPLGIIFIFIFGFVQRFIL